MLSNARNFKKIYIATGYTELCRNIRGLGGIIRLHFHQGLYDENTIFLSAVNAVIESRHWSRKGTDSSSVINALIMTPLTGHVVQVELGRYRRNNIRLLCRGWSFLLNVPSKRKRPFLLSCCVVWYAENKSNYFILTSGKQGVIPGYPQTAYPLIHDLLSRALAAAAVVDSTCKKTGNSGLS